MSEKEISILIGAGFSKSLANLPLAKELSEEVLKKLKEHPHLSEAFKNTEPGNFNYEKFAQYLESTYDRNRLEKELRLSFQTTHSDDFTEPNLCRQILHETLLDELLRVDYHKEIKNRQMLFIELIKTLLKEGYKLHFFDLNHDLVLERLLSKEGLEVQDFFKTYEWLPDSGYFQLDDKTHKTQSENKFHKERKKIREQGIWLNYYDNTSFRVENDSNKQLFHYKPHGALNFVYLMGLPVRVHDSSFPMTGLHLIRNYALGQKGQNSSPANYDKNYREQLKIIFKEKSYPTSEGQVTKFEPAILNQAMNKASILTRDFLMYFPEVYSKFISLGERNIPLLTIGYGFQDSHFNTAILNHYKTQTYQEYTRGKAKILFSGYEEIPLITDKLKGILVDEKSGLMHNQFNRTVLCSDHYFENFLNTKV